MNNSSDSRPAIIVIFGVTGDLVRRKLLPALCNLLSSGLLDEQTVIVGVTRQNISIDQLLGQYESSWAKISDSHKAVLKKYLVVKTMDITKGDDYAELLSSLNQIETQKGVCMNRLYYLSIPPQVFGPIVRLLGENGLNKSCQHGQASTRLLVEKPFGYDLPSAKELIKDTAKYFSEDQIFRIDHYLAKDTVQNILAFRFNNAIFESLWDHKYVASINIVASEQIGIENRVTFYEQTGALRDLIQSHLLQLLSIVAMEQPKTLSSKDVHKSKLALLKDIDKIPDNKVYELAIRGQYNSYRKEVKNPKSNIETYAAIRLSINNRRWKGVPIIIRTGKSLSEKKTEVIITFKRTKRKLTNSNTLTFRIQPNEGIDLCLYAKSPGLTNKLEVVNMDFSYGRSFKNKHQPDAYERVLMDAVRGDHTLFASNEEIIETWRVVGPILEAWSKDDKYIHFYPDHSNESTKLLAWLFESKT